MNNHLEGYFLIKIKIGDGIRCIIIVLLKVQLEFPNPSGYHHAIQTDN